MSHLTKIKRIAIALLLTIALPVLPASAQSTITVALIGEVDTFDPMTITKDIVSQVTQHFVETLYTFDSSWNVAPLLAADMPDISDGGKVYRIPLREGITLGIIYLMTQKPIR